MEPEIKAFVSEMLHDEEHSECGCRGPITCISCIVSSWSEDVGSPPTKNSEEELHIDEHDSIFVIGDWKLERYGSTDTDWQIKFDSGSTVDCMPNDECCQVEAVPFTGRRANGTMFAANGTKIESEGEKKFKAVTDDGFHLDLCGICSRFRPLES